MNEYQPNFEDPRVKHRIKKAIGFAHGVMSETKPHPWSTRYIDRYFGSQRNDLSKYLRKILLTCVKSSWNKDQGRCKEYVLNKQGFEFLRDQIGLKDNKQIYPIVVDQVAQAHCDELGSGQFQYTDKSQRFWHPLQNYRRTYRTQILQDHGYKFHYDIVCAAPNLIHQYSQQIPLIKNIKNHWQQGPMDLYLFALRRYLKDRTQVRQELAQNADISYDQAKEIITALFCGARISLNPQSDINQILKGDLARIEYLKQDQYLTELRNDIKICWDYIKPMMLKRTRKTSQGSVRCLAVNSRQKWSLYFDLERSVIMSVRTYLEERSVRYFLIHDGFSCDVEIDTDDLRDFVRNQCGFDLEFEFKNTNP